MTTLTTSPNQNTASELRSMLATWGFAAFMPLPVLVAMDPANSAMIACLYLGVINAWLVTEFHRSFGLPQTSSAWNARTLAVLGAVSVNTALFIAFGLSAGVATHFPFPLMALLSVIPAIGIIPWLLRLMPQNPYAAIILGGLLVFACKLAGCVVARILYGADYLDQGYAAADWRTAKVMISVLWILSSSLSLVLLLADYMSCIRCHRPYRA